VWIDSHCHLEQISFDADVCADVLQQARAVGVQKFLTIGVRLDDFASRCFLMVHPDVFFTVGLHPCYVSEPLHSEDAIFDCLVQMARDNPRIIGLGETGFDLMPQSPDFQHQKSAFWAHMRASVALDLPLIIHTRQADQETFALFQEFFKVYGVFPRFVLHCFTGSLEFAKQAIEMGGYISFSGIVTFPKAQELQSVAQYVPADRFLVETDCPWLAPVPFRGQKNRPELILHTGKKIANLRECSVEEVETVTSQNFHTLFSRCPLCPL
jgi:TatD DNase family protein